MYRRFSAATRANKSQIIDVEKHLSKFVSKKPSDALYSIADCVHMNNSLFGPGVHYNCSVMDSADNGFQLCWRKCIVVPFNGHSTIATMTLDKKMQNDESNIKELSLRNELAKRNNTIGCTETHVEDPRVFRDGTTVWLTYNDSHSMYAAKCDLSMNVLYQQKIERPIGVGKIDSDAREKNWIQFAKGDKVYCLYSANPFVYLKYKDTGASLALQKIITYPYTVPCSFGENIRGGCPPVPLEGVADHWVWFYHTREKPITYKIGAYVTHKLVPVAYCEVPILSGEPIVFPCGAVSIAGGYRILMGVNDRRISYLDVDHDLLCKNLVWLPKSDMLLSGSSCAQQ